ncbi:DUF222 domain-containing protein [Kribbella catacumbae]|uniref:DUF222 domain-containing protein n=1 Tax=Kribbella catacumbae TaxID=460086 RepID=UPI00036F6AA9|nr:DUF222 domain-containing protein [Kribbella catacumbae]
MFASDLDDYTARETLSSTGELHAQRNRIDVEILRHAQHFADLHPGTATVSDHELVPGGEQSRVYGGSGCPSVAEFAVAEFGVMIGRSTASAARYMGQALALRHRLPRIWAQVESGHATAWKACNIASACMDLSEEAAGIVDRRVANIVDTLSPLRLHNIVKAALWEADPDGARAIAEEKARERGVWAGRTDDHGTTVLFVKAPTGDVIRFQATLDQIADALAALGDTSPINQRRARAIGIIADPVLTTELLQIAQHLTTQTPTTQPPNPAPDTASDDEPAAQPTRPTAAPSPQPPAAPPATPGSEPATEPDPAPDVTPDLAPDWASPAPVAPARHESEPDTPATRWPWDEVTEADEHTGPGQLHPCPQDTSHGPSDHSEQPDLLEQSGQSGQSVESDPLQHPDARDTSRPTCRPSHTSDSPADRPDLDSAALRELLGKLADLKQDSKRQSSGTMLYLHITDETLLAGEGVARIDGCGPALVTRLEELLGHNHITIRPVIDLKDNPSVDAYEIPQRIRERVKLRHPIEQFPYGTGDSSRAADLDHIEPFRPNGPPGQTSVSNLIPLRRFSHRVKTHGRWKVRRLDEDTLEWTTRYGFKFIVDHQGTRPADRP